MPALARSLPWWPWLGLAMVVALADLAAAEDAAPAFRVIVHPSSDPKSLERRFLGDVFLKKATRWPAGDAILPVDLEAGARARREFSENVLGRSVGAVKSYWQQIIFSGRGLPPPELADDAAVVAYVLAHPGAIGYVSGSGDVRQARVITVR